MKTRAQQNRALVLDALSVPGTVEELSERSGLSVFQVEGALRALPNVVWDIEPPVAGKVGRPKRIYRLR